MMRNSLPLLLIVLTTALGNSSDFRGIPTDPTPGDKMLEEYFEIETRKVTQRTASLIDNIEDWSRTKADLRRQLYEMLGLQPLPARTDLKAKVTGSIERDGVVVEKIVFQSRPGLYVTGNFYRPAEQDGPLPTILYVCGHGRVKIDGVSYGNKTHYQHHGTWFAKNGYCCLTIDTLQLGEIEGIHHGTHNLNRWWWNARSYTPAGVEAWNCIRALDYLETREEVDREKFGVTGRSGGGAYTFWISALDERIKVSAPVAGITSMRNHIVDGCIEGHCDCMFMVNTYRWDFPLLASLVAPRPQLILNTDDDRIFPLDGVVDIFQKTRKVYESLDAKANLGLAMYQGGHKDTQPLRVPAFHWFERHLKGKSADDELTDATAEKIFEPQELKVLDEIPGNERNTFIDDYFTKRVPRRLKVAESSSDWAAERSLLLNRLRSRCFRAWPSGSEELDSTEEYRSSADGIAFSRWSFTSQNGVRIPYYLALPAGSLPEDLDLVVVNALDENGWDSFLATYGSAFPEAFPGAELPEPDADAYASEKNMHQNRKWGMIYLPTRGIGPTAWTTDERERIHIRRRFALLGQTIDAMRVWDIRRCIQAWRELEGTDKPQLWVQASGSMAGNALYASLFEKDIHTLDLHDMPASHREGPVYLNVLRFTDIPQVAAIVGENTRIRIYSDKPEEWRYLTNHAEKFEWPEKQMQLRAPMEP
ncbi:MAG: acetylxylan esterase [Verrucomicrobiales bacterium]|nr:acetylxylan esterase [Verrucomicrobiales bacterium]